jgi:TetR/AcrR family transcriptional repressor of uid operon
VARLKDETKRTLILQTAKALFAHRGFHNTSVADIAREAGLPVGSLYTYFSSKEKVVRVIVEEGWSDLSARLEQAMATAGEAERRLAVLIDDFLPALFDDVELINILLSEAIEHTHIEEKIERISSLIYEITREIGARQEPPRVLPDTMARAGLVVYFLGVLDAVRISRLANTSVTASEILAFVHQTVESTLGVRIGPIVEDDSS